MQAEDDLILEYELVENEGSDLYSIRLLDHKFNGVVYRYGTVKFVEDPKNDRLMLSFVFKIDEANAKYNSHFLENSVEFKTHIGHILSRIIEIQHKNLAGAQTVDVEGK